MTGCGCKNQGNQTPPPAQQTNTQTGQSQPTSQPIQESIRKVVQKYYKK
jgi:DNA-binding protein Fis